MLITLVIIGVIAAMTIPTLMNKTNKQEYVSRLKKAYSTLGQVTAKIIAEEGLPRGDMGGWATSTEAVYNMYKKHMSNIKECGRGTTGCFTGVYKRLNGTTANYDSASTKYSLIMSDGTELYTADGDFSYNCSNNLAGLTNVCAGLIVDVNGAKGPNTVGYDAFGFYLTEDRLVPVGCETNRCLNTIGWECTCKVLKENAINYW